MAVRSRETGYYRLKGDTRALQKAKEIPGAYEVEDYPQTGQKFYYINGINQYGLERLRKLKVEKEAVLQRDSSDIRRINAGGI